MERYTIFMNWKTRYWERRTYLFLTYLLVSSGFTVLFPSDFSVGNRTGNGHWQRQREPQKSSGSGLRKGRVGSSGSASGGREGPTGIKNSEEVDFPFQWKKCGSMRTIQIFIAWLWIQSVIAETVTEQGTFLLIARGLKREAKGNPQVVGRSWRERSSEKQCYIKLFVNF